eukprot:superscaffoldBa00003914_g17943
MNDELPSSSFVRQQPDCYLSVFVLLCHPPSLLLPSVALVLNKDNGKYCISSEAVSISFSSLAKIPATPSFALTSCISWRGDKVRSISPPKCKRACLLCAVPLLSTCCGAAVPDLVISHLLSTKTSHPEVFMCQPGDRHQGGSIWRSPPASAGLCFALDPSTVPPPLRLSNSSLTVFYQGESPPGPLPDNRARRSMMTSDPGVMLALPQVCADVVITRGQYYWEVDVCNSSIYRVGVSSLDGSGGWWLERQGLSFCTVYDGSMEPLCTVPPQIKTLGVFLNIGGGTLSFHNPLTQEHLTTLPTRFNPAGVLPALGLGQGRLRLRSSLPTPPHVFLSKDSAYRGACGASGSRWRREIPFQSVRKVIQKFEELAASDTDSGLVSTFGSSCSTLASLPDLGLPGMFPSGHTGQEAGAE